MLYTILSYLENHDTFTGNLSAVTSSDYDYVFNTLRERYSYNVDIHFAENSLSFIVRKNIS